ncbi:hypothetical protein [Paenibacillus sp. Marseille-Q4541]|uniref:hypothetical protein n=1 Tax=Paenibacillus sp. Marseille-Q4541 TaxID=2831522 RepID=UPI001BAE10C6|nr:hypothetical protein [Paenibacillus sp. Marseille-Q4541]
MIEILNGTTLVTGILLLVCVVAIICLWMIRGTMKLYRRVTQGRQALFYVNRDQREEVMGSYWIDLVLLGIGLISFLILSIVILFVNVFPGLEDLAYQVTDTGTLGYQEIIYYIFHGQSQELKWNHYVGLGFFLISVLFLIINILIIPIVKLIHRWRRERAYLSGKGIRMLGQENEEDSRIVRFFALLILSGFFGNLGRLFRDWYLL